MNLLCIAALEVLAENQSYKVQHPTTQLLMEDLEELLTFQLIVYLYVLA